MTTTRRNIAGSFKNFLAWPSGALMSLISSYPAEQNFYIQLGTVVWLVAFIGGAGMMLNLRTTGGSHLVSLLGGVLWFLIIVNLDRFLLMVRSDGSGWVDKGKLILRITLALCISIVVGESVIQYLLRNEIRAELQSQSLAASTANHNKALGGFPEIAAFRREVADKQSDLRMKDKEIADLRQAAMKELDGNAASGQKGDGPFYREKRAAVEVAVSERRKLEEGLASIQGKLDQKEIEFQATLAPVNVAARNESGLVANQRALFAVIKRDPATGVPYAALSLIMVLIEITPLVAKLGRKRSIHDTLLAQQEETSHAMAETQGQIQRHLLAAILADIQAAGPSMLSGQEAILRSSLVHRARYVIDHEMNRQNGVVPRSLTDPPLTTVTICLPGQDDFDVMFPPQPDLLADPFVDALKGLESRLGAAGRPLTFANFTAVNDDHVEIDLNRELLPQIGVSMRVWFVPGALNEVK